MNKKNIEKKIINQYSKNLNYFKKNHPDTFIKLNALSEALDYNEYEPRFTLEYINKEFNIYNIVTKEYVYPNGPNAYNKNIKKSLNLMHENGFNTLHEFAFNITKDFKVASENEYIKKAVVPYTEYINKNFPTGKKDKEFIVHNKVLIIGTWLGYHIDKIFNEYKPSSLLIIEPDIEIFRLSTFIYDYEKLAKKCQYLYFSVAQNNIDAASPIEDFLLNEFLENYFIKFHLTNEHYKDYLQHFAGILQFISPLNFNHSRMIDLVECTTSLLKENQKFINLKSFNNKSFANKPVLILGAGPSLKYNIEWLEKNQNMFVIVAVAATLPRLDLHNIKPDIVTSLDGHALVADQFKLKNKDLLDDCLMLFSSMTHQDAINLSKKSNLYIYEVLSNIKLDFSIESFTASNVGEMTYALMLIMGIKNIYLLGIDCAFDRLTGASHDEVVSLDGVVTYDDKDKDKDSNIDMLGIVETQGNFREKVKLTRIFYNAVIGLGKMAEDYKDEDQLVYNLSDGAYFKYTKPLNPNKIDFENWEKIDKNKLKSELKINFEENSSPSLNLKEKYNLQNQIKFVESIIVTIKEYKESELKDIEAYQSVRLTIMNSLMESELNEKSYLSEISSNYFQFIDNYINFFFNDKNLDNKLEHMKKIQRIWAEELIKILVRYKKALEI